MLRENGIVPTAAANLIGNFSSQLLADTTIHLEVHTEQNWNTQAGTPHFPSTCTGQVSCIFLAPIYAD